MENRDGMQNSGPRSESERMDLPGEETESVVEITTSEPVDIYLFKKALDEKLRIFMDRREQYGSYVENSKRFPKEHESGLYLKAARVIRDIEDGEIKEDTLIDLSNYCDIVLSGMGESETDK